MKSHLPAPSGEQGQPIASLSDFLIAEAEMEGTVGQPVKTVEALARDVAENLICKTDQANPIRHLLIRDLNSAEVAAVATLLAPYLTSQVSDVADAREDHAYATGFNAGVVLATYEEQSRVDGYSEEYKQRIAAVERQRAEAVRVMKTARDSAARSAEEGKSVAQEERDTPWPHCPITRRPFFMNIDHPEMGEVPTFGGPFDSYTIPEADDDGELRCERYDHDAGAWVEGGEPTGLWLVMGQPAAKEGKE